MHLPGVDFQPMVDAQSQLLLEHSDLLRDTRQRSEPSPSVRSVAALQRTVERLSDDLLQLETLVDSDKHSPEKSPTDSAPPPAQLYVPPSLEDSLSDENEAYPPPAEDAAGIFAANGYCQPSGFSTPVPTAVYPDPPSPTPTAPDAPVQVRERAPSPPQQSRCAPRLRLGPTRGHPLHSRASTLEGSSGPLLDFHPRRRLLAVRRRNRPPRFRFTALPQPHRRTQQLEEDRQDFGCFADDTPLPSLPPRNATPSLGLSRR